MSNIKVTDLPANALLRIYAEKDGCYTDCYSTDVAAGISLADYVSTFYTTWLFRLERVVLRFAVSRPSTDVQARQVAEGTTDRFAAWTVEARNENQLLVCDMADRTRSWFMVEAAEGSTRLYFGSAVVPVSNIKTGEKKLGFGFSALLGFHKLYSRALLAAARRSLLR